jgi:putative ABC transport system permease protein
LSFETAPERVSSQSSATWWEQWGWSEPIDAGAVTIITREEALARETRRWLWQTPIGLIFQLGVVLALMVGAAIVYMVLATDVANRLPEYATLLAIGYSRKYLASIVMTQAIVLGVLGFFAAWGGAELLYRLTSAFSSIPLIMEPMRVIAVCLLGLVMCCLSGLLALRKLWKAEPANLF